MVTKAVKIEYLQMHGIHVAAHNKLQRNGYTRLYIDEIEGIHFTTSTIDQKTASQTLDALYWSYKLQEGK